MNTSPIPQELQKIRAKFGLRPVDEFLLKHGKDYATGPVSYAGPREEPGQCFRNASLLAFERPALTYVEGRITVYSIPIEHAWCINRDGVVIDPTLGPARDGEDQGTMDRIGNYFGVPFSTRYLRKATLINGIYGLLDFYSARTTLPKLLELGLDAGQQWLLDQKNLKRKKKGSR